MVKRRSLVEFLAIEQWGTDGGPILFPNPIIRQMFDLARSRSNDVFYDLGCGFAQNLILGAYEYGMKCIGVERDPDRYRIGKRRVAKWEKSRRIPKGRITLVHDSIENVLERKVRNVNLKDASIIFYGMDPTISLDFESTDRYLVESLESNGLKKDCRLISYFRNGIFPEIKPAAVSHPFYLYKYPFNKPTSRDDWLRSVIHRKRSIKNVSTEELWAELAHNHNIDSLSREQVKEQMQGYADRLKKTIP